MRDVQLHGKPAYKLYATFIVATKKAAMYDLDGDQFWIPKAVSEFTRGGGDFFSEKGTIIIEEQYYLEHIQ